MKLLYEQVYDSLKQDILSEKYKVGDRIPSEKELSAHFDVSRITSKKALEKLREEGYVYSQRGRGTFVAEFNTAQSKSAVSKRPLFGLVMTSYGDSFGNTLLTSMEKTADDTCFLLLKLSFGNPEREEKIIQDLIDYGVSGLIVYPAEARHYSSEILKMVVNKFPLVLIDRAYKGISAAAFSTDNAAAAHEGTDYLINLGHEHIGVLMPSNNETTTIEDRLSGIVSAFAEEKLSVNRKLWCADIHSTLPTPEATQREDIEVIKSHIQKNPEITAIFALEYTIGLLAKIAIEELGLQVPNDISIICFDSPPLSYNDWNFTHLAQNEAEVGRLAVERLMEMYRGNFDTSNKLIPATLIEGNTTGPA